MPISVHPLWETTTGRMSLCICPTVSLWHLYILFQKHFQDTSAGSVQEKQKMIVQGDRISRHKEDYCLHEQYACYVLTTQPLPRLSRQIQHGGDAISCLAHTIASPAYSSSVVCPPHTYTGTHARTHLSLLSCDVARAAELIPTHSLAILPWKGKRRSVWEGVFVAMGDLLFSPHYSRLPAALVVRRIWQLPSSLYRIRWGKHCPLDALKKMLFFTRGVVLTWRLNICEWAVHGFRSKLVLWISRLT